jgi:hypothetical protein
MYAEINMRSILFIVLPFLLFTTNSAIAQQAPTTSQSSAITSAVNAQASMGPIRLAQLTGTVTVAGGASGTISLAALGGRSTEISLQLPTGSLREVRVGRGLNPIRSWTGVDGVVYKTLPTDLKLPHPAWFLPYFFVISGLASPDSWSSDLGTQNLAGQTLEHLAVWQRLPNNFPASATSAIQQQTQADIYIDPTTFLPASIIFHVLPDPRCPNEILLPSGSPAADTVVQVNFSDYRIVKGRPVPFHLQVVQQGSVYLDITLTSVSINPDESATTN